MIRIIVQRAPGDRPIELVDPLITNEPVAILTGRTIIDRESTNRTLVEVQCAPGGHMAPGSLVEVIDGEIGSYRARLVRAAREYVRTADGGFSGVLSLSLERDNG